MYLTQENRPTSTSYLDGVATNLHSERIREMVDGRSEGSPKKIIGSFCLYVPEGGHDRGGCCGGWPLRRCRVGSRGGREVRAEQHLTGAINEKTGGVVVGEECCTGSRYYKDLVLEDGDTVDEMLDDIADRYLKIQCAIFTPHNGRRDDVICMARELHADGIIDASLSFCTIHEMGAFDMEKAGRHPLYAPLDRLLLRGRRPAYDPHPGVSRDDLGVCRAFSIGVGQPLFVWPHLCPSESLWCGGKSVCGAKEEEESPAGGHIPTVRGVYQIFKLFVWHSD